MSPSALNWSDTHNTGWFVFKLQRIHCNSNRWVFEKVSYFLFHFFPLQLVQTTAYLGHRDSFHTILQTVLFHGTKWQTESCVCGFLIISFFCDQVVNVLMISFKSGDISNTFTCQVKLGIVMTKGQFQNTFKNKMRLEGSIKAGEWIIIFAKYIHFTYSILQITIFTLAATNFKSLLRRQVTFKIWLFFKQIYLRWYNKASWHVSPMMELLRYIFETSDS